MKLVNVHPLFRYWRARLALWLSFLALWLACVILIAMSAAQVTIPVGGLDCELHVAESGRVSGQCVNTIQVHDGGGDLGWAIYLPVITRN